MLRAKDLQDSLIHLVGWEQYFDTNALRISDYLTQSESGLYFQQIHPLLTLDNLYSIAPNFDNIQFDTYSAATTYEKGAIVKYNNKFYKSKQITTGNTPAAESAYWYETSPFSEWLESKTRAGIQKAIIRFCSDKSVDGTYKSLCENKALFSGSGRIVDTIDNKNKLVGFEIVPIRSKGVTLKINKIGLQFNTVGTYTLYLMHSSSLEPVRVFTLTKTKASTIEWFDVQDVFLPYQSSNTDAGGSWYLCYNQSALPTNSKAIRKSRDWSKGPCNTCSRLEYEAWVSWSRYLEVHPFSVSNEDVNYDIDPLIGSGSPELWDIELNTYDYTTNYGINLDVTVNCDITDFIIEQRDLFKTIIAYQVAIDLMREFVYNPNIRTNRSSINASKVDILNILDGDSASFRESGLSFQLDNAFKAVEISTKGIDRVCLPCNNHGIKYRHI